MQVRVHQVPNHTPEQVREYIEEALLIVSESEVDDDLKVAVFVQAASMLSSKTFLTEQPQAIGLPPGLLNGR